MTRSPFEKNLPDLQFDDIQSLKDRKRAEDEVLEYKEEVPGRLDIQKEVLGFANNIGGYLVIGVETEKPDNIPKQIIGVPREANMQERIVSTVRDNSSPSFVPHVRLICMPSDVTRCIIVVHSPESSTVHMASDGRIYYRTDNQTIPIRPEFVAKIIGKERIREELEKTVQSLDWRRMPDVTGVNLGHNGWFGIICCPIPPNSFRIPLFTEIESYRKTLRKALHSIDTDERPFADSFRMVIGEIDAPLEMIQLYENGLVSYGNTIPHGAGDPSISEGSIKESFDDFLKTILEVYHKASFDGCLRIIVSFNNIAKWHWRTGLFMDIRYRGLPFDGPYLERRHETTVSAIESDVESTRAQILSGVRRAFGIY